MLYTCGLDIWTPLQNGQKQLAWLGLDWGTLGLGELRMVGPKIIMWQILPWVSSPLLFLVILIYSSCSDFSVCYGGYKKAMELLATADCLVSLSEVAKIPGYVW